MNSDSDYHIESEWRTGWNVFFWLTWIRMFYSQQRFVLLRRTQDLKPKSVMETTGVLGKSNSEQSSNSSLYVLFSSHVWGFEGRRVWHFRCKKRKLIFWRCHTVPKDPVTPAYCFQGRKWFRNTKTQERELRREPALHKNLKISCSSNCRVANIHKS